MDLERLQTKLFSLSKVRDHCLSLPASFPMLMHIQLDDLLSYVNHCKLYHKEIELNALVDDDI